MIRAAVEGKDGRPIVLLGITEENLKRLMKGEPIMLDAAELGLDGRICIFGGTTEQAILEDFVKHGLISADTDLSIDPKTIPDRAPVDVVDSIILTVPDEAVPTNETVHEVGPSLQKKLREMAQRSIAAQDLPGVRKIELRQLTWSLTSNADDMAEMTVPHDCEKCRQAMVDGEQFLRDNPGKWLAVGRAEYTMHYG